MKEEYPGFQQVQTSGALGEVVRRHRKARRLTQRRLAGLANVSVGFLSDFENGKPTTEIGPAIESFRQKHGGYPALQRVLQVVERQCGKLFGKSALKL